MIKAILENIKLGLSIVINNKLIFVFLLSALGLSGGSTYLSLIPEHPHAKAEPKIIIKTIIKKVECGESCKKIMFTIAKQVMHSHDNKGHTF